MKEKDARGTGRREEYLTSGFWVLNFTLQGSLAACAKFSRI